MCRHQHSGGRALWAGAQVRAGGGRLVARAVLPTCVLHDDIFTATVTSDGAEVSLV